MNKKPNVFLLIALASFISSVSIAMEQPKTDDQYISNDQINSADSHCFVYELKTFKDVFDNIDKFPPFSERLISNTITDQDFIAVLFNEEKPDAVIHLAAESHVDRSISDPLLFVRTNVIGTANLLNVARKLWLKDGNYGNHATADSPFASNEKLVMLPQTVYSYTKYEMSPK